MVLVFISCRFVVLLRLIILVMVVVLITFGFCGVVVVVHVVMFIWTVR